LRRVEAGLAAKRSDPKCPLSFEGVTTRRQQLTPSREFAILATGQYKKMIDRTIVKR